MARSIVNYQSILDRIRSAVSGSAYLVPTGHLDPEHRHLLRGLASSLEDPDFDAPAARDQVEAWYQEGRIDRPLKYSALGVIAASPGVDDLRGATELASLQELAALDLGGAALDARLASVERHRGVIAFRMGRFEIALESFVRAMERERTAENLGNVLSTLIRLGESSEARALLGRIRRAFPAEIRDGVEAVIRRDDDLRALRELPDA